MKPIFADTSYYLALLNADDEAHALALQLTANLRRPIITTAWVLSELGNYLADTQNRRTFETLVQEMRRDKNVQLVPPTQDLFDSAFDLYRSRPDKSWSFVDCTSFKVMEQKNLMDALSTDHHFNQAGFNALLR